MQFNSVNDIIEALEADLINENIAVELIQKGLHTPVIVFSENGKIFGGKESLLINLKMLAKQIEEGAETSIFLNMPHD